MSVDLVERECAQFDCAALFLPSRLNQRFCSRRCLNRHPRTPGPETPTKDRALGRREVRWKRNGWTSDDFDLALVQEALCAICSRELDLTQTEGRKQGNLVPHADHDHSTGVKRDVLCAGCNTGLGHFRDDPEALVKAAAYIIRHREKESGA